MSVHWGGKGPGHVSRWPKAVGPVNTYSGATMLLDFLNPVLDPRITFSRGTNATLIDSTGRLTYAPNNLILRSEEFNDAAWTKGANASVAANQAIAPNGTLTADRITFSADVASADIFQSITSVAGTTYTASVYVWADAGEATTVTIQLQNGSGVAIASIANVPISTSFSRLTLTATATDATVRLRVTRGTGMGAKSLYLWGAQLEAVTYQTTPSTYVATTASAYYGPRFDYDPVTLAPRGLLIEEARTNLLLQSDNFTTTWATTGATITANATASPDGTANADALVEDASTGLHITQQFFTFLNATAYTVSVYIKASTRTWVQVALPAAAFTASQGGFFNLTGAGSLGTVTGTPTSRSITAVGNGWYRITITATSTAAAGGNIAIVAASADGTTSYAGTNGAIALFAYGAQLEAGSFATSYIPTVASTVTRNADVATMTGTNFSSWYNQSEGTFVSQAGSFGLGVGSAAFIGHASDGTTNEYIDVGRYQPTLNVIINDGGVSQANLPVGGAANGTVRSLAVAYKVNDFAASVNGATPVTDTSGTIPTVNRLAIGSEGLAYFLNGHIRTIAYFNTRLPNAQLQTLTAQTIVDYFFLQTATGDQLVDGNGDDLYSLPIFG